jgi:molybdopterin biosynthesis enzyme MoaB
MVGGLEGRMDTASEGLHAHLLVVSATPGRSDDSLAHAATHALQACGHDVADTSVVGASAAQVEEAVRVIAASEAKALLVLGGTTAFEGQVAQAGLAPLMHTRFAGFRTLFTQLWHARAGSQAVWAELEAGLVGSMPTFALPPSAEAVDLAVRSLIGPQLAAAVGAGLTQGRSVPPSPSVGEAVYDLGPDPVTQEAVFEEIDEEPPEAAAADPDAPPPLPAPSGGLGQLGRGGLSFSVGTSEAEAEAEAPTHDALDERTGWLRAVREVQGTVHLDRREELPQPVEGLAPLLDVLHNAGESGVLELPSGVRYSLWGFPDLRRPSSKVLAVGWGKPLAEVLALHRYPVQTGTTIAQNHGLLPHATEAAATCEAVTGSPPPADGADSELFAVEADAVYLLRGGRVHRFDGRKESAMGTPKQALVTLALAWSNQ